ncbi:MAG: DUF3604 domain-containing protein [Gammaproteobacteria bacterium]|nr:DUF3604 domain-containing protein [Gammaproteobacteria bacterium]
MLNRPLLSVAGLALLVSFSTSAVAKPYSPYASTEDSKRVLWGDTHLHTTLSLDARAFGVELDQEAAYRFARGEQVTSTHGEAVKLARPLDFLVVSDHSDAMGTMAEIISGNESFMTDEKVVDWNKRLNDTTAKDILQTRMEVMRALTNGSAPEILFDSDFFATTWQNYLQVADQYNEPGRFTAMIGYEWTSSEGGDNLHRNVLYRDGAAKAGVMLPYTVAESFNPEGLWDWMQRYEDASQGQVLAIAHNGNISNGIMFPEDNPVTGKPLSAEYAKTRARWEPLYEVTQIKGDTETHPMLSPNDEFADYETWARGNFEGVPKTDAMIPFEYARAALTRGLRLDSKLGTNPYQFGMIGSTDSHTGLATGDEDNFFGKMSYMEPRPGRWDGVLGDTGGQLTMGWEQTASGYAAVWATDNTREAIFDAMMRRETYATTGPRMTVQFDAVHGKQQVPMGGELGRSRNSKAPVFKVSAWKDPLSANLDRVQIIKGWENADGATQEKVFNVVWAGDRFLDAAGKLPAVGNTVDIKTASYRNSIGASQLAVDWQDPEFDAKQKAYYYARVLEIPTPRWVAYDAMRFNLTIDNPEVPLITQERAYTSPIWYTP